MIQKLKQLLSDPTPDDPFYLMLILIGLALVHAGLRMVLR